MLGRWDPFHELSRVQDEMSRTFSDTRRGFSPAVDIVEDKETIFVRAELPGIKLDDIHINVERNVLTLKGERRFERETKPEPTEKEGRKETVHRIERSYGSFTRSFSLPDTVDADRIDAHLDAGVLEIRLPKRGSVQPKRIPIRSAG